MSPRFPSLAPSPSTCLLALVSPTSISPPLNSTNETTTNLNQSSSHLPSPPSPSPQMTPLPPSPPASPAALRASIDIISNLFVSDESKDQQHRLLGREGQAAAFDFELVGLDVENRTTMAELMSLKATRAACEMGSEVVGPILPALPKTAGYDEQTRAIAGAKQKDLIARRLFLWTNLAPSPLIVLIVTVILLERLVEIYPQMGANVISQDAPLRIAFAGFLLAVKLTSDASHVNSSFVGFTPWKLRDINTMETQLLKCLRWDLWISSDEVLHRAAGFWKQHQTPSSPSDDPLDASLPAFSNLFLMQRRVGVTERGWRGGLVRGAGESGSRIPREDTDPKADHVEQLPEPETTVWRRGRLERRGSSDAHGRE